MHHELEPLVGLLRVLSDRTRMHILMTLADGERNVSSLCRELGLPQPTVSHHLSLLRERRLISNHRRGKNVFYGLHVEVLQNDGTMAFRAERYHVQIRSTSSNKRSG